MPQQIINLFYEDFQNYFFFVKIYDFFFSIFGYVHTAK